jgi:hypothetical protein
VLLLLLLLLLAAAQFEIRDRLTQWFEATDHLMHVLLALQPV